MIKAIIGLTLAIVCLLLLIASINSTITVLELEPTTHGITVSKFYAVILLVIINALLFGGLLVNIYGIYIAYKASTKKHSLYKFFKDFKEELSKEDTARPSNYDFRRNPEGHNGSGKSSIFDDFLKFDRVERNRMGSERPLKPDEAFGKLKNDVLGKKDDKREGKEL